MLHSRVNSNSKKGLNSPYKIRIAERAETNISQEHNIYQNTFYNNIKIKDFLDSLRVKKNPLTKIKIKLKKNMFMFNEYNKFNLKPNEDNESSTLLSSIKIDKIPSILNTKNITDDSIEDIQLINLKKNLRISGKPKHQSYKSADIPQYGFINKLSFVPFERNRKINNTHRNTFVKFDEKLLSPKIKNQKCSRKVSLFSLDNGYNYNSNAKELKIVEDILHKSQKFLNTTQAMRSKKSSKINVKRLVSNKNLDSSPLMSKKLSNRLNIDN